MILITGGAGYVGSHINKFLHTSGYETLVFDNLVYGHEEFVKWGRFIKGDLADYAQINDVFKSNHIDAVIHCAAYAYVGESVEKPSKYYHNNVGGTLNLLDAMVENGVKSIVFSSTCATYGIPDILPITEDVEQKPINPYGKSKLMVETIIDDYSRAYNINYVILRYFNAAGADPDCEIGEWHEPEPHLIPILLETAAGKRGSAKIFATDYSTPDGSCIRDYIHVSDLASAHGLALSYLSDGGASDYFNLGNAKGNSVLEVIDTVKRATGRDFKVEVGGRRPGDVPILIGSSEKIQQVLGWRPIYADIDIIIRHAWTWYKRNNIEIGR